MTVDEINERIENKKKTISKKKALIEKKQNKINSLTAKCEANGWDVNDKYCRYQTPEHQDCYYTICDLDELKDDVKRLQKQIGECNKQLEKYREQLLKTENNAKLSDELPAALKSMRDMLADKWTAWDIAESKRVKAMSYDERKGKMTYSHYEYYAHNTEEYFRKVNEREAERWVLNLQARVQKKIGDITSWDGITFNGVALNGYVEGTKGRTYVETIGAGGYNIQRAHYRTILH